MDEEKICCNELDDFLNITCKELDLSYTLNRFKKRLIRYCPYCGKKLKK
ncbi:unnamed protein product [marine sediment metagenome]|uniref:Uncharacterized protein n=1 Tax=marine sediment metagenome TaxID=412755 RepID=X0UAK4_9ZZZZ